ncbi:peptidase M24, partial [Desulfovibrio sp. XJ01]|nr:peptidase M24 [Nitratidesulfovibrio liaohensis]
MRPFQHPFLPFRTAAAGAGQAAGRNSGRPCAAACCLLCLALALAGWLAVRPEPLLAATSGSIGKAGPIRPAPDDDDGDDAPAPSGP